MVRVRVLGVALDPAQEHVILLKPVAEPWDRILPVWIGAQEATAILVAVQGAPSPRPLAHELMLSIVEELSARVERVEVTRIDDGTFYAAVTLDTPLGVRVVDARPSDAIALASRADAPMFVADDVIAVAGIADTVSEQPDAASAPDEDARIAEFRSFLDEVEPDDFED
ncbi:bifunctional nuclease family protein [Microbacterium sp. SORGH_AS_0862]|uniref:bifunctional nuclease family protein n=1 Tax=Microbacterium sp. SORGH_AS_0862 TaxID=3041789 RepID=UPI002791B5AF|nr:bifunctional nuclease family protein [Microbacterium sp. SORGH_AS_0862]MDQ1206842.1 bifunctional DNase/RNase [Microbacterium sp. SORGH_AS_0862]